MEQNLNIMLEQLEDMQNKVKQARIAQKQVEKEKEKARREAIMKARSLMREFKITPQEISA